MKKKAGCFTVTGRAVSELEAYFEALVPAGTHTHIGNTRIPL